MAAALRRVLVLFLALAPVYSFASDWQQPTPEELSMKSYPAAPDAPAVYLFREETVDDTLNMHYLYARIKILSEKGKEMFGDVEIPYEASAFSISDIAGRTIESDGTVVPFSGKPIDKLLAKAGGARVMVKAFSMPNVQVGSILEYRYKLRYSTDMVSSPQWYIQQPVPVLKAYYHFVPTPDRNGNLRFIVTNENGHQLVANQLLFSFLLPPGDKVKEQPNGSFDLNVENVPATPHEDFLPPLGGLTYRLIFYYSPFRTLDEYWKTLGKYWSKDFDRFANPSAKIHAAVSQIVAPGDNDQQKVSKIYAAVMKLDNTSFTRQHSADENKAEGLKVKTADDIWAHQRGDDDEITRLFVAMVRAAGLKAYGAVVVNRDRSLFEQSYLNWNQLDDELAVVSIDGKEVFFDPGQRYCAFGKLHWKHTWTGGVRQTSNGIQLFQTPGITYTDDSIERAAQLTLDPDGKVHGLIQELTTGAEALRWRQAALRGDEDEIKKQFQEELQRSMPPGVQVKTNHFIGLADYVAPLMVIVNVNGTLGTATGKHVFVPAVFFEAGNPPRFAETQRENAVDMHYPYMIKDQFQLTLPPNATLDSVPQAGDVPFAPNADYVSKFVAQGNTFAYGRLLRVANILYKSTEYPALRSFYQKISADDQEQVALTIAPTTATAAAPVIPAANPAGGK